MGTSTCVFHGRLLVHSIGMRVLGGDYTSQPRVANLKPKQVKPKLKVMHIVSKDENGAATISCRTVGKDVLRLREAVGHDVQQAAEETGHKVPKAKETVKLKDKDELSDEQRSVLKALHDLGGKDKDIHSMDIAKKLGFDKTHKNAPRAPVRNAMERLHALHYVTSKKEGVKYSFRITDKGIEALKAKHNPNEKPAVKPVSNPSAPSSAPDSRGIECPACKVQNPSNAEFCKNCGTQLKAVQAVAVAA